MVCVKLCKVATYMKPEDNSVLCFLVVTMLNELKVLKCEHLLIKTQSLETQLFSISLETKNLIGSLIVKSIR